MTRTPSGSPEEASGRGRHRKSPPPGIVRALITQLFGVQRPDGVLTPGSDWRPAQRAEALRRLTELITRSVTKADPEELAVFAMRRSPLWLAPDADTAKAALRALEQTIADAPPSFNEPKGERHWLTRLLACQKPPVGTPRPAAARAPDLLRRLGRLDDDGTTLGVVAGKQVVLRYRIGGQKVGSPKLTMALPDMEIAFGRVDAEQLAVVVDAAAVLGLISDTGLRAVAPLLQDAAGALRQGNCDAAINFLRRVGAGEWSASVSASLAPAIADALESGKWMVGVLGETPIDRNCIAAAVACSVLPGRPVEVVGPISGEAVRSAQSWEACLKAIPLVNRGAVVVVELPGDDPTAIDALRRVAHMVGSRLAVISHKRPPALPDGAPEWWHVHVIGTVFVITTTDPSP